MYLGRNLLTMVDSKLSSYEMATLQLSTGMTPIKIRGKRHGMKAEKWHSGKQRRQFQTLSVPRPSDAIAEDCSEPESQRSKRRKVHLARLEKLPPEMIQAIFVYSGNLDLPLTSPVLSSQLSGRQLQSELMTSTLARIVDCAERGASTSLDLAQAARLLNSRFMTWSVFSQWLLRQGEARDLSVQEATPNSNSGSEFIGNDAIRFSHIWSKLRPSAGFMPPSKLLHGPWNEDKVAFLKAFTLQPGCCKVPLEGVASEVAYEGLVQAVEERSLDAIKLLRGLRIPPDQELLRKAVVDFGCNRDIVLYLLQWCVTEIMRWTAGPVNREAFHPQLKIDFLDPVIWAWAERARATGNSTGEWLIKTLKRVHGVIESEDTQDDMLERESPYSYP